MKFDEPIEQALSHMRLNLPPALDEKILAAAAAELRRPRPAAISVWARRAAIVFLGLGSIAAVIELLERPAFTLAEVAAEYAKQTWVHLKFDNGKEQWTNLVDGRQFHHEADGHAFFIEPSGRRMYYMPQIPTIFVDKWFVGDAPPPRPPQTAWSIAVPTTGGKYDGAPAIEEHSDTLSGQAVQRFDCYYTDAMKRRLLITQVWADPKTRLPIQRRDVLDLADREQQHRDAIVGHYDFPTTGPSTIYDLGVSRDLPVVDEEKKTPDDVQKVIDAGKAARAKFPTVYRIIIRSDNDQNLDLIYHDGNKFTFARYFQWTTNFRLNGEASAFDDATPEQMIAWTATHVPVQQSIDDGEREFSRLNNVFNEPNKPPATARVMGNPHYPDNSNYPPGTNWPYFNATQLVAAPADAPPGVVVLQRDLGERRDEFWVDPQRDYSCIRNSWSLKINGKWKFERVYTFNDWKQAASGRWWAATQRSEIYGFAPKLTNKASQIDVSQIYLDEITPQQIPAGTFHGPSLLEGAKLETY